MFFLVKAGGRTQGPHQKKIFFGEEIVFPLFTSLPKKYFFGRGEGYPVYATASIKAEKDVFKAGGGRNGVGDLAAEKQLPVIAAKKQL